MESIEQNKDEELQTTYEKGRNFETHFSIFMKRELNWSKVRVGAHMAGKANVKGANIDVIGERLNEVGKRFFVMTVLFFAGAVFSFFTLVFTIDIGDELLFIIPAMCFLAAVFFYVQSNLYHKENAWVECKNLKGKANINQIEKSIRELKDYKSSGNKEYLFEYHYFVSASGFIENALKFAIDNNIICYQLEGNTFKRVGYWD